MEAPYSQSSWGDPHIAERAEAILDKIAQGRLSPCSGDARTDEGSDQAEASQPS